MIVVPGAGCPRSRWFRETWDGYVRCVMGIALFLCHFGSRVADVVFAQVSQQRRDLGHPAEATTAAGALSLRLCEEPALSEVEGAGTTSASTWCNEKLVHPPGLMWPRFLVGRRLGW